MATVISTPADMVNLSLARIGYKGRIGSLYDGTLAAKKALDLYGQTRDQLIREGNYEFAERSITATLLKQAPPSYVGIQWSNQYPCLPWLFQYQFPSDCLKLRSVKGTPTFVPNVDPQYNVFSIDNDNTYTPAQKVVLCNVPSAIFTYAAQVTNPQDWDESFIEAFASALGRRFSPFLVGLDAAKLEMQDEQAETALAEMETG